MKAMMYFLNLILVCVINLSWFYDFFSTYLYKNKTSAGDGAQAVEVCPTSMKP
jgi:hypothetical protein